MAAILDESGAAILDEGSADLYDEAGSSSGPARYVLTADVTIPWPAVWSEVIQGAAAPQVATPSFPASGSPIINATGITVAATIAGGTVTAVTVNGAQSGASDGTYLVSPAAVIAVTYTGSPSWSWTAAQLPQSGTSSMTASVAAAAPPGGQAGTIPQSTFLAGTPLWLDPSAELFAAIGSGNLMAWRDGTDSVGHAGISNLPGALMSKITDYGALSSTETDDVLPIVDVHDTTMAPAGTTKKITVADLLAGVSGTGTVTSVTATDTSIVVSGTDTIAPTLATGTLDVIATQHPPAGNWSNNSHKITSLANGSGAQDAAAFGQIATAVAVETSRAEAAEALLLPLAGGTLTGSLAVGGALGTTPSVLTDASTIAVNAALSDYFRVTLGGNRTLGTPSNPTDGQGVVFEIIQDGTGSRTLAYAAGYSFPASIGTPVLSSTPAYHDFLAFRYDAGTTTWYCTGFVPQSVNASPYTVSQGGTGVASLTAYELIAAGTTTTGATQQIATGSAGQLLGSGGSSALPSFQSLAALGVAPVASPAFTGNQPTFTTSGGLALTAQGGQASITSPVSITDTSIHSIGGMTVPSGDPAAGSVYRLTCFGYVTESGTLSNVTFGLTWGGTAGTSLLTNNIVVTPTVSLTAWFTVEALVTFVTASTCSALVKFSYNTGGSAGFAGAPHLNGSESPVTVTVNSGELLSINATLSSSTHITAFSSLGTIPERVF